MYTLSQSIPRALAIGLCGASLLIAGCSGMHHHQDTAQSASSSASAAPMASAASTTLSGAQEAPPVATSATGSTDIHATPDMTVVGSVTVAGMAPTAAHIHQGATGVSGPIIVPLVKISETTFSVPPNTKFSDAQMAAYKAGQLYVNVHSAAHPAGEIRAQLMPQ